jgi:tetratricopeptide (TPR) repeat protein
VRHAIASGLAGRALACGLLAVAVLVVYGQVTSFGFAGVDDSAYVAGNARVLAGPTLDGIAWAFTTFHASNWHPLTWLSLMADAAIGAGDPGTFHRTNLLLHLANTLLAFGVLVRMTGRTGPSAAVAALFAVHPLHVESVAWIAERKDVLSTTFWLLAMVAWVRWAERPSPRRYLAVALALAAGLLAKPMLVTLPFALVLLDVWPLGRATPDARGIARSLGEKLPLLLLAAASCTVTLAAQVGAMRSLERFPLPLRAANAVTSWAWYLGKTVWPADLAVLVPYDRDPSAASVVLAVALVAAVSAVAWRQRAERPYLLVGWLWYLGTLAPVLGLVQVGAEPRADRYAYVPLLGIWTAVAWGVADLVRGRDRRVRILTGAVAAASIVLLAWTARAQVAHWRNAETLFRHAIAVHPEGHRARVGLAVELLRSGRTAEAIAELGQALAIAPDDVSALANLGAALLEAGQIDGAIERYRVAVGLAPDDHDLRANLGIALARQRRDDEAREAFREALLLDPEAPLAHKGLGLLLAQRGESEDALVHLTRAVEADPADSGSRLNLAIVLMRLEQLERAERELREVLRRDPASAVAHKRLGMVLTARGLWDEAIREIDTSLRIDPDQPELRDDLRRLRELGRR